MIIITDNPVASRYNMIADQGETFERTFTWTDEDENPIDLSGATAVMRVRKLYPKTYLTPARADSVVVSLTDIAGITLGGADGTITTLISSATILTLTPDTYNYQLIVTISGNSTVIAEGLFYVRQGVL